MSTQQVKSRPVCQFVDADADADEDAGAAIFHVSVIRGVTPRPGPGLRLEMPYPLDQKIAKSAKESAVEFSTSIVIVDEKRWKASWEVIGPLEGWVKVRNI